MSRNQRIKSALKKSKVTQTELAEEIGVRQATISDALNKEEDIDYVSWIDAVVKLTGENRDYILYGTRYNQEETSLVNESSKIMYEINQEFKISMGHYQQMQEHIKFLVETNEYHKELINQLTGNQQLKQTP